MAVKEVSKSAGITASIGLVVVVALGYFFRPVIHPIMMLVYSTPALIVAGILLVGAFLIQRTSGGMSQSVGISLSFIAMVIIFLGLPLTGAFEKETLSNQVLEDIETTDELPEVDSSQARIMPRSVARRQASDSLSEPRYQIGESDIAISDSGKPYWSMPLVPDGLFNVFGLKQKGASQVDMTSSQKNISRIDTKMDYGLGMQITDNLRWHLTKQNYWKRYGDTRVLEHNGTAYLATPYIDYNYHIKAIFLYTTPKFSGVALTDSDGDTEFVDREDVTDNPILEDQSIYPYGLARKEISSLTHRNGFVNAWFFHEDQIEIAEVPGQGNDQPFTVLTENDGVQLFVAAEPYGNAQGLYRIYLIDGQTGEKKEFRVSKENSLFGARKATDYVKQANSKVNWAERNEQGRLQGGFTPSEPLPVIVDNTLYWQVRVVPTDSSGIAFTSFVNSESGDVITTSSDNSKMDSQIKKFLDEGNINLEEDTNRSNNETETETSSCVLEIKSEGTVVREFELNADACEEFE